MEERDRDAEEGEEEEADPVAERTSRKALDWISFGLAGEFVTVPGDDEEVLHVFADDLAVVAPKRRDGVEQKRERVQPEVPELLIVIAVVLF